MAKASNPVLLSTTTPDNVQCDIIQGYEWYMVTYQGEPFNLRRHNLNKTFTDKKYPKLSYPTAGQAIRTANRLNKLFGTKDFHACVIKQATVIKQVSKGSYEPTQLVFDFKDNK